MRRTTVLLFCILTAFTAFSQTAIDTTRIHRLNEVVVTGSNNAVGRNLLPYTVATIGGKQLEATGNTQLLSAVSGLVPSLLVSERNIFGFGVSNGGPVVSRYAVSAVLRPTPY